jgi:predicted nucleic acid-binding protein
VADPTHLIDNSALARANKPPVAAVLEPKVLEGLIAMCSITALEQLFSVRSGKEHRERRADSDLRYTRVAIDQPTLDRAIEVQGLLAERGQHRGASLPDLMVAAAAERAGLTVLHYDADFDLIATVTGQPVEWVVPRGSVD